MTDAEYFIIMFRQKNIVLPGTKNQLKACGACNRLQQYNQITPNLFSGALSYVLNTRLQPR
jgi:hypothetical protein